MVNFQTLEERLRLNLIFIEICKKKGYLKCYPNN